MTTHDIQKVWHWSTPISICILTALLACLGYSIDRELHHIDGRFDAVDKHYADIVANQFNDQKRLDCLADNQHWCCKDSERC